jgi:RES domain-containing protein
VILWRVSKHAALDGGGGLRASGRWHSRGRRVVYCAPSPAAALLEVLVHAEIDTEDIPVDFRYLEIEASELVAIETTEIQALGAGWRRDEEATRRIGDAWLHSGHSALLRVPSAIVPATWNVLLNPRHPASALVRIVRIHEQAADRRLVR